MGLPNYWSWAEAVIHGEMYWQSLFNFSVGFDRNYRQRSCANGIALLFPLFFFTYEVSVVVKRNIGPLMKSKSAIISLFTIITMHHVENFIALTLSCWVLIGNLESPPPSFWFTHCFSCRFQEQLHCITSTLVVHLSQTCPFLPLQIAVLISRYVYLILEKHDSDLLWLLHT